MNKPMTLAEQRLCSWQYGSAGSFVAKFFDLICIADGANIEKLRLAFPEEVATYLRFSHEDEYWDRLEAQYKAGGKL